jgi:hypothetical protein
MPRKPTIKETRLAIEDLNPINRSHVKQLALYYAKNLRPAAGFERVSESFVTAVMYDALKTIKDRVARHPSKGKTLK